MKTYARIILKTEAALCAILLLTAVEPPASAIIEHPVVSTAGSVYIETADWPYLRAGLNYVEASGKTVPTNFCHPGGVAFGPLALTPIAVKDVKQRYKGLDDYDFDDVIHNQWLYEKFAALYADLLLGHYLKLDYRNMPREEAFQILQRAWFWGPTLYKKKGRDSLQSRERMAREYIFRMKNIPTPM